MIHIRPWKLKLSHKTTLAWSRLNYFSKTWSSCWYYQMFSIPWGAGKGTKWPLAQQPYPGLRLFFGPHGVYDGHSCIQPQGHNFSSDNSNWGSGVFDISHITKKSKQNVMPISNDGRCITSLSYGGYLGGSISCNMLHRITWRCFNRRNQESFLPHAFSLPLHDPWFQRMLSRRWSQIDGRVRASQPTFPNRAIVHCNGGWWHQSC